MTDIWGRLSRTKSLDTSLRQEIEDLFGQQGKSALAAIDAGKIKKYLDFYVVEGRTAEYVVDDEFCTCRDFMYRNRTCWHLIAVRIARETGQSVPVDAWYQDILAKKS